MIARMHITAGFKSKKTYLKNSFSTSPCKIGNITEDKTKSMMRLMMMSSSPGILDNDRYEITIDLEEEAELELTTQGYQRIFTMQNEAEQSTNIRLAEHSSLCYLPHPNVPHKFSSFRSINTIHLNTTHHLVWSEIITCGRKLCNEAFYFTRFQNTTSIYLHKKLVVKENLLLEPGKTNLSLIGQLEGYTHQSSLLYLNNHSDTEYLMYNSNDLLSAIEGIEFGISALPVKGFSIRMFGRKAEQLFEIHKKLAQLLAEKRVSVTI